MAEALIANELGHAPLVGKQTVHGGTRAMEVRLQIANTKLWVT